MIATSILLVAVFLVLWVAAFRSPPLYFSISAFAAGAPGTPINAAVQALALQDCMPFPPYQTQTGVDGALCSGHISAGDVNVQFRRVDGGAMVVARTVISPASRVVYGDLLAVYGVGDISAGTRSSGGRWYTVTWPDLGLKATIYTYQSWGQRPSLDSRVASLLLYSEGTGR